MALFLSFLYFKVIDERFSILSRGNQCAFMSLLVALTAQHRLLIDRPKTTLKLNNFLM